MMPSSCNHETPERNLNQVRQATHIEDRVYLASYVPKLPRMLWGHADQARHLLAARATRWVLMCGSVAGGLWLAFATYHLSGMWGGSGSLIP